MPPDTIRADGRGCTTCNAGARAPAQRAPPAQPRIRFQRRCTSCQKKTDFPAGFADPLSQDSPSVPRTCYVCREIRRRRRDLQRLETEMDRLAERLRGQLADDLDGLLNRDERLGYADDDAGSGDDDFGLPS